MHARNRFRDGYDFSRLIAAHPPLADLVRRSPRGDATIDFADWFTTLVSKSANLPRLKRALTRAQATHVRTLDMAQGQKQSRMLAWTFMRA